MICEKKVFNEGMMAKPDIVIDDWFLTDIAWKQAISGKIKSAQNIAVIIDNENIKRWVLDEITRLQSESGNEVMRWSETALRYSTMPFLLDLEAAIEAMKLQEIEANIFCLGKSAGSMDSFLNDLKEKTAR